MTVESTNQEDPTVFPSVKEYPLRMPREVNDGAVSNNHRIREYNHSFNWYDRTDDEWMGRP